MERILAAFAILLLAGCATPQDVSESSSSSGAASTSLGVTNVTAAPPKPSIAVFSLTNDFTVTFASATQGSGSNFGQQNCLEFSGIRSYGNATATLEWSGTAARMELVVGVAGESVIARIVGASPLRLEFEAQDMENENLFVAAQSEPTGAVAQQPVQVGAAFAHLKSEEISFARALCAY